MQFKPTIALLFLSKPDGQNVLMLLFDLCFVSRERVTALHQPSKAQLLSLVLGIFPFP